MSEPMFPDAKIAAARAALDKAAAILLDHAEGVAMMAMLARSAVPIRNWRAERSLWAAATAAAAFAGHHEAYRQARDDMWPTPWEVALREAVERLVGPDGGMPPPLSAMPGKVGPTKLGVTPRRVHAQAWRSHLAANVSRLTMVKERGYP